jgi:hypothetical protein
MKVIFQTPTILMLAPLLSVAVTASVALTGCNYMKDQGTFASTSGPSGPVVAGQGETQTGTGALTVPTGNALVMRIENGLQGGASHLAGNFRTQVLQSQANLSNSTDPTAFGGPDQNFLIAYSACADAAVGPNLSSKYGIIAGGTVVANKAKLIAAGMQILNQHTAGLAGSGSTSGAVTAALTAIEKASETNASDAQMAFVTMCTAASTAGSTMMGF